MWPVQFTSNPRMATSVSPMDNYQEGSTPEAAPGGAAAIPVVNKIRPACKNGRARGNHTPKSVAAPDELNVLPYHATEKVCFAAIWGLLAVTPATIVGSLAVAVASSYVCGPVATCAAEGVYHTTGLQPLATLQQLLYRAESCSAHEIVSRNLMCLRQCCAGEEPLGGGIQVPVRAVPQPLHGWRRDGSVH